MSEVNILDAELKELGDGLVLRRSTKADIEALVDFNARVHSDYGLDKPDEKVGAWTRDLMERPHPTFESGDFTIVEDTATGKIVSSMNLISQTWSYNGIPFGVGRPELVGTLPEYRNRGLVRAQFEIVHEWSSARGEKLQAVTGIPYYYRLFGYEMALSLDGGRMGYRSHVPELKDGEKEPYIIRAAKKEDQDFLVELCADNSKRYLINCVRDREFWLYEINGKSENNVNRFVVSIIETPEGEPVGYLIHPPFTWGDLMVAVAFEIKPDFSWSSVTPSVIRYLLEIHGRYSAIEQGKTFEKFGFWMNEEHPVYHTIPESLPRIIKPYAWYIRIPDLADFLRLIAPVLNERLADSPMRGYSGEIKLTFYQKGIRMVFDQGHLDEAESWKPFPQGHSGDAAFPELTFLQLLMGYRSLDELDYAFADCWCSNEQVGVLLNHLFPKRPSCVFPIA